MSAELPQQSVEALLAERAWVRALARSLVADENVAADVEQETWLAATSRPPSDLGSPRAWLGTVLRNFVRRDARGAGRRAAREFASARGEAMPSSAEMVARAETHRRVVDAVLALPEPYRATVLARFFEDLPPREIARQMQVPVETVRTRLKRALAQLRARLDAEHGGDGRSWGIALLPLAAKGGLVVKTTTKAAIAAAAALLLAGVGAWTWMRPAPPATPSPVADAPVVAKARVATSTPPATVAAGAATVSGEVWRRSPEALAAGVTVRLASDGSPDATVVADARGRFRFEGLTPGTRGAVHVESGSEAIAPAAVAPLLPGETRSLGILWLEPTGSLDVAVTMLDGKPIAGARLAAWAPSFAYPGVTVVDPAEARASWRDLADPVASATTDAAGRATLRGLARGRWRVDASKDGFVTAWGGGDVGATGSAPVRIVLARGSDLAGRVEDRAGRPVAGLIVRAGAPWTQLPSIPRATTGVDGRFVLAGLPDGDVEISVARRGEPPIAFGTYRVPTSSPVRLVVGGPTITGRAIDAATGAPIAAVRVRAGGANWSISTEAVSDDEGNFVLSFLAPRVFVYDVRAEKEGYVIDGSPRRDPRGLFNLAGDETARLDLKLRRAEGLRGVVTHDGVPVRAARVAGLRGGAAGIQSVATTTDGDGRYLLDGVAGSTVLVQVQAPGLIQPDFPLDVFGLLTGGKRDPKWSVEVPADSGATFDIEMATGEDVSGRVLGTDDAAIEGAFVGVGGTWTSSAADGSFSLHGVDLRGTAVSASKPGFARAWEQPEAGHVTIRLAPMPVVRGTVHAGDGPLEDGWVEWAVKPVRPASYYMPAVDQPPLPIDWRAPRAPVAADGSFEIAVEIGDVLLRAGGRGCGPSSPVEVAVKDGGSPPTVVLDVSPTVSIRGRVAAEDGTAVAGARVEIDPAPRRGGLDDGRPAPGTTAATTDADGRFEVPSATQGAHRVFVDADGFLPATVDAAGADVQIRLAPTGEVRGTVLWGDGRPVDSAMVTLFPKGMPSPFGGPANGTPYFSGVVRNGAFRVVLPPGTYTALVSASGNSAFVGQRKFEDVSTGAADAKFTIDLGPTIAGRIVAADDGAPLANSTVSIFVEGGRTVAHVTADADGRFQAEVPAAGQFAVVAMSDMSGTFYTGFVSGKRYLRAVAHGVSGGRSDLEMRLPVGLAISGVLVDDSGAPVAGRWVVAHRLSKYVDDGLLDDGWQDRAARTDAAGGFVVTGLATDSFRLFAGEDQSPRRTPLGGCASVAAGARDVRAVLPGVATISGRVVDETGAPFVGVSVSAKPADASTFYSATTQTDGVFTIVGVAAFGTYEVSAGVNERAPVRAVDVAPGATGIVLKLTRGLHADGRAVDASGKPLPRATLIFKIESGRREAQIITDADGRFAVDNLLPGAYRVENFVFRDGKGVYVPCGGLNAGDTGVELRRSE